MDLKFLKEFVDGNEVKPLYESTEDPITKEKKKELFITGPFLQGDIVNKNGRIYPIAVLESAISTFKKDKMKGVGVAGELNHPQSSIQIDLERVSHYVTELYLKGKEGFGKAKIASTPKGEIARALINDGLILGVSTRGLGKLDENEKGDKIVSDYELITVDIVSDPSAPNAFVEAVMEGLNYYIDNNSKEIKMVSTIEQILNIMKSNLSTLPKKQVQKENKLLEIVNKTLCSVDNKNKNINIKWLV